MDNDWWKTYNHEVNQSFFGGKFSNNKQHSSFNVIHLPKVDGYGNSGAAAISMAVSAGAKRIVLLGYDCQFTNGMAHWHGDHPANLGNAKKIEKWHLKFQKMADEIHGVEIINATRQTALTMFVKKPLLEALK